MHTALLLLGTKAGNPAIRERIEDDGGGRWVDIEPSGGRVSVSLRIRDAEGRVSERPITEFFRAAGGAEARPPGGDGFLFAGSRLKPDASGTRRYLADLSGNLISLSTFGDELLCLPGVHSHSKSELRWEVDPTYLPPVGSAVTLRLRPLK